MSKQDLPKSPEPEAIKFENVSQSLAKGQVIKPGEFLARKTIVTDTGGYAVEVPAGDLSREQIDAIYRKTIMAGVIDHHYIDSIAGKRIPERCATSIVVDYQSDILKYIKENDIKKVDTHFDSDLDSIASAFLVSSLIQNEKLPVIAPELAQMTNLLDYGRFDVKGADKFLKSLPGVFGALKAYYDKVTSNLLGSEVFGSPECKDPQTGRLNQLGVQKLAEIKKRYADLLAQSVFEVLNACNAEKIKNPDFNLTSDVQSVVEKLDDNLGAAYQAGSEEIKAAMALFESDFEKAERKEIKIRNKKGELIAVPLIITIEPDLSPFMFTNMAYQRSSPETVIAVFGGPNRKGGDMYDIGITPDSANFIDLGEICVALNEAEKEKRDIIINKPEDQRTPEEKELISKWEKEAERLNMSGPRQVITKDPTVLVAGGSLIAASRTSLLRPEEFKKVLTNLNK